jgi:hypothetical protein
MYGESLVEAVIVFLRSRIPVENHPAGRTQNDIEGRRQRVIVHNDEALTVQDFALLA